MIGADDDPHRNYEFACKVMRLPSIGPGSTSGADSQLANRTTDPFRPFGTERLYETAS
jgi:hypothetical protein